MTSIADQKKEIIRYCIEQGILLTVEKAQALADEVFVTKIYTALQTKTFPQDVLDFFGISLETKDPPAVYDATPRITAKGIKQFNWPSVPNKLHYTPSVKVTFDYKEPPKKRSVQDFVQYFNARYKALERFLRQREELSGLTSISRIASKQPNDTVALVAMISDKQVTKNNNLIVTFEDPTGTIKGVITAKNVDLFAQAKDLVLDEVVGVVGTLSDGKIIFVKTLLHPDIPLQTELKKAPTPGYAVFISDLQVGSANFLETQFIKFLHWIRGETGSEEQKKMAEQVGYLLIGGDVVDGIGIYAKQEEDLTIKDIYLQFEQLAEYLKLVPSHIKIIMCPGNHDPVRLAEPQPALIGDYAKPLNDLPNMIMISNPGIVNIHHDQHFTGFNVLMYHGFSFDHYAADVESIRMNGGYQRADLIMKYLLQRRHVAPAYASTLYIPDAKIDPLVIHQVPDFFLTGHIHYSAVAQYRCVTMINGSCWQGMTEFQNKLGHSPVWARANIIDLQTRKVKVINFDQ